MSLASAACEGPPPSGSLQFPVSVASGGSSSHLETVVRAEDGLPLYLQGFLPRSQPKASVLVVHGLRDHSGRYAPLAAELVKRGWSLYAYDLRGHGRSAGPRVWVDRFEQYVEDTARIIARVRELSPDGPLFLMGHSMGGAIAALYAERYDANIDGLILSAPAIESSVSGFEHCGANLLADFSPYSPRLELDMTKWSRDPAVTANNQRDPLVYQPGGPIHTGVLLLDASAEALAYAPLVRVPTIVFHGTADSITLPSGSQKLFDRVRAEDRTIRLYPGLYHDLWNEPERATVVADLVRWLDAHDRSAPQLAEEELEPNEGNLDALESPSE